MISEVILPVSPEWAIGLFVGFLAAAVGWAWRMETKVSALASEQVSSKIRQDDMKKAQSEMAISLSEMARVQADQRETLATVNANVAHLVDGQKQIIETIREIRTVGVK